MDHFYCPFDVRDILFRSDFTMVTFGSYNQPQLLFDLYNLSRHFDNICDYKIQFFYVFLNIFQSKFFYIFNCIISSKNFSKEE